MLMNCHHAGQDRMRADEGPGEIDAHHALPFLDIHFPGQGPLAVRTGLGRDAGIVDQNVDGPQGGLDLFDGLGYGRSIRHVGRNADGSPTCLDRLVCCQARQFRIMVEIGYGCACQSEPVGHGAADAAPRSCHKGHTPAMGVHLRTSSMILPRWLLDSIKAWASRVCSSGKVVWITVRNWPEA